MCLLYIFLSCVLFRLQALCLRQDVPVGCLQRTLHCRAWSATEALQMLWKCKWQVLYTAAAPRPSFWIPAAFALVKFIIRDLLGGESKQPPTLLKPASSLMQAGSDRRSFKDNCQQESVKPALLNNCLLNVVLLCH